MSIGCNVLFMVIILLEWICKSGFFIVIRDCLFINILMVKFCINFKVKFYFCFEICWGSL